MDNKITFSICDQGGCNHDMVKAINKYEIKGLEAAVIGSRGQFFSSQTIKLEVDSSKLEKIIKSLDALKAEEFDHRMLKC